MFEEELSLNRDESAYVPPQPPVMPAAPAVAQTPFPAASEQQPQATYQAPVMQPPVQQPPVQPTFTGFTGMPQQARATMSAPQQYQPPFAGAVGQAPQFQGVNLLQGKPKRIPGAPFLNIVLSMRLAKDEDGARKVLLIFSGMFALATAFSVWFFFRTPGGDGSPYPIMYFEDVTPAHLNLIPPEDREAYLQSLPSKK